MTRLRDISGDRPLGLELIALPLKLAGGGVARERAALRDLP